MGRQAAMGRTWGEIGSHTGRVEPAKPPRQCDPYDGSHWNVWVINFPLRTGHLDPMYPYDPSSLTNVVCVKKESEVGWCSGGVVNTGEVIGSMGHRSQWVTMGHNDTFARGGGWIRCRRRQHVRAATRGARVLRRFGIAAYRNFSTERRACAARGGAGAWCRVAENETGAYNWPV